MSSALPSQPPNIWASLREQLAYLIAYAAAETEQGASGLDESAFAAMPKHVVGWPSSTEEAMAPWGTVRVKAGGRLPPAPPKVTGKKKGVVFDVAPRVFARLRSRWRVPPEAYIRSLTGAPLEGGTTGSGKSGMLFFRTSDAKYIIKTLPASELTFLRKHLKDYYNHMKMSDNTLLTRFFGVYKVKIKGETMRVVVMNNVFHTPLKVREVYDLKGSTKDRLVTQKEIIQGEKVLKDLNLKKRLHVGPEVKDVLLDQLERDSQFLAALEIMDYSLLLGIYTPPLQLGLEGDASSFSISVSDDDDDDSGNLIESSSSGYDSSSSSSSSSAGHGDSGSDSSGPHSPTTSSSGDDQDLADWQADHTADGASDSASARPGSLVPPPPPPPPPPPFRSLFQRYLGGVRSADPQDWRDPDERHVYFVGVIDILQRYNVKKRLEHAYKVKSIKKQSRKGGLTLEKAILSSDMALTPETTDETAMSAVDPHAYQARFMAFMRAIITDTPPTREDIASESAEALSRYEQKKAIERQKALNRELRKTTHRTFAAEAIPGPAQLPLRLNIPVASLDEVEGLSDGGTIHFDDLDFGGTEDDLARLIESEIAGGFASGEFTPNAFAFDDDDDDPVAGSDNKQ